MRSVEVRDVVQRSATRVNCKLVHKDMRKCIVIVGLTHEDSCLAHNVANGVCNLVGSKGHRVLDAIVVQRGLGAERGGEHDLICERRDCGDGGLTSFESKLRQAVTADTLSKVRRAIQKLTWALIPAARIDPKRHFTKRVAVLLRWGAGDPFNLGGWSDSFADVMSINADADVPGNWHPLWGWTRTLLTADDVAAKARDAAKRKAAVAA